MDKIINITAEGTYKVTPTLTKIRIKFDNVLDTYKKALNLSVRDANAIKEIFGELGFKSSDLKNTLFNITTKYKNEYKDGISKEIFKGYEYNQEFVIRFKRDNKLLGRILTKLSNCINNPKFSIYYEIENLEEAEQEAFKQAVNRARSNAEAIAMAANVKLIGINQIDNLNEVMPHEFIMYDSMQTRNCCMENYNEDDFDLDFNPDDFIIKKRINIQWNIL